MYGFTDLSMANQWPYRPKNGAYLGPIGPTKIMRFVGFMGFFGVQQFQSASEILSIRIRSLWFSTVFDSR